MNGTDSSDWREQLKRSWSIPLLERLGQRVRSFSRGDRVLFYALAILVGIASLSGLYALEQSLLVQVPTYGGSLVEGEVGSPQFINPLLAISDADRDLSTLTYAGLMGLSGSGALVPVLAESYSMSADGKPIPLSCARMRHSPTARPSRRMMSSSPYRRRRTRRSRALNMRTGPA